MNEESIEQPNNPSRAAGEFTIVVAPPPDLGGSAQSTPVNAAHLATLIGCLTEQVGVDRETAVGMAARALLLTPRKAASILKKHAYSVKRQSDSAP